MKRLLTAILAVAFIFGGRMAWAEEQPYLKAALQSLSQLEVDQKIHEAQNAAETARQRVEQARKGESFWQEPQSIAAPVEKSKSRLMEQSRATIAPISPTPTKPVAVLLPVVVAPVEKPKAKPAESPRNDLTVSYMKIPTENSDVKIGQLVFKRGDEVYLVIREDAAGNGYNKEGKLTKNPDIERDFRSIPPGAKPIPFPPNLLSKICPK
jgi:hypothetical protein